MYLFTYSYVSLRLCYVIRLCYMPYRNISILRVVQLSKKLLWQGYVKERLRSLRKFFGRYGDLIKQYEVPLSRMLYDILDDDHIQRHPPLIRHYIIFYSVADPDLIIEFDFLPYCQRFPYNICNRCGMPIEDAYSAGHLVLSLLGFAFVLLVETTTTYID